MMKFADAIFAQTRQLAAFSEQPDGITRVYLSAEHKQAGSAILEFMRAAGMQAHWDVLGNVVGCYAAKSADAKVLMLGSHMDSVRNAGAYDGTFGILSAIACVAELHRNQQRLEVALEVIAFGDEEGVRFGATLIGSRAFAGKFDPAWLETVDATGISMAQALRDFGTSVSVEMPGTFASVQVLRRDTTKVLAYVESHIEQGPVLLNRNLAVGAVSAIAGATRVLVRVRGLAGHAGTVPMPLRRDALACAASMCVAIEQYAVACVAAAAPVVATVGKFEVGTGVLGGAVNVIPGEVRFTIDIRSGHDAARLKAVAAIRECCAAEALKRNLQVDFDVFYNNPAAICDTLMLQRLASAIHARSQPSMVLPSGAGHDAMAFDGVLPQAMLFVRCGNGGISHHPDETMTQEDAEIATEVLLQFLLGFAVQ
jgi:allantoate deiminase